MSVRLLIVVNESGGLEPPIVDVVEDGRDDVRAYYLNYGSSDAQALRQINWSRGENEMERIGFIGHLAEDQQDFDTELDASIDSFERYVRRGI